VTAVDVAAGAATACAGVFGIAGSAGSGRTCGTFRTGNAKLGSESSGSVPAVLAAGIDASRSTTATGITYSARSTSRPKPAHQ
jgi:hypothetical protein